MNNKLTIDVTARLTVSDESADRCMRLLEMWMEDNPGFTIVGEKDKSGKIKLEKVKLSDPKGA